MLGQRLRWRKLDTVQEMKGGNRKVVWQKADNMEECIEIGGNIESGQWRRWNPLALETKCLIREGCIEGVRVVVEKCEGNVAVRLLVDMVVQRGLCWDLGTPEFHLIPDMGKVGSSILDESKGWNGISLFLKVWWRFWLTCLSRLPDSGLEVLCPRPNYW